MAQREFLDGRPILTDEEAEAVMNSCPKGGLVPYKVLTKLTLPAARQEEYWRTYCPKMYKAMAESGTLVPTLQEKSDRMHEEMLSMMHSGMYEPEAWEVLNQEIFSIPPENKRNR